MKPIQMVDLAQQYQRIKTEIDAAMQDVILKSQFIQGEAVRLFEQDLSSYLNVKHVLSCGNGTDALQMAFMALELNPGDEVIVPSFNYIAAAEAAALMGLIPVFVDVDVETFCIDPVSVQKAITSKTKALIAVHLFGQCAPMEPLIELCQKHQLFLIEDTAQAIGAEYTFSNGSKKMAGTIGDIGTLSFFPSKNLGCFGDGGAMLTNNDTLATALKMVRNHGQKIKYTHEIIGINSRLDTIQAALLSVKLQYLPEFTSARNQLAQKYNFAFNGLPHVLTPITADYSNHVFHQYTLRITGTKKREDLAEYLKTKGIPSMIYYPIPLHQQPVFKSDHLSLELPVSSQLCNEVISLPMHTEMDEEQSQWVIQSVKEFLEG
jgi:UDP-2-acetamido-2-deoxy-ribo-hexuluronate aminotransferase